MFRTISQALQEFSRNSWKKIRSFWMNCPRIPGKKPQKFMGRFPRNFWKKKNSSSSWENSLGILEKKKPLVIFGRIHQDYLKLPRNVWMSFPRNFGRILENFLKEFFRISWKILPWILEKILQEFLGKFALEFVKKKYQELIKIAQKFLKTISWKNYLANFEKFLWNSWMISPGFLARIPKEF